MTDPLPPPSAPDPSAQPAPARFAPLAAALVLVSVAAALVAPTLDCPRCFSVLYDWRYFQTMEEVFRTSVVDYHQVPLWNPYACGGEVGLANPQSTALAPTFLFTALLGTAFGIKVALFVYLLAALHGAYALARRLGSSRPAALVAGVAFGGSGWFALHLSTGHINFAGAALYPYLILCYLAASDPGGDRGPRAWVFAIPGGALVAWMAALGGTYTVPMGVILLGTLALTDAVRLRSARPLAVVAGIGVAALLLGAPRFLPLLEFVKDHPRHVEEKDGNNVVDVVRMFFAWRQSLAPVAGHVYWWHEYCCHLPYLGVALAALAALHKSPVLTRRRALAPLVAFAAWTVFAIVAPDLDRTLAHRVLFYADAYHLVGVWALFALTWGTPVLRFVPLVVVGLGVVAGRAWPHGPWWLLRMLPVYRDLRVPARYLVLVALVVALFAARGLDIARELAARRWNAGLARRLALVALAAVVAETLAFDYRSYKESGFVSRREPVTPPPAFYQTEGQWSEMMNGVLAGHGVLKCDEEAPLQRGELDAGDVEQVRLLDPSAGGVRLVSFSPNALRIEADLARPTDVLINENWNEHWIAEPGSVEVRSVAGRLGARVPAGRTTFTVRYRPRSFVAGAWIAALAWPSALVLLALGLRRRRR